MNILQYTLLFSKEVRSGKKRFFAINSNQFDKKLRDYTNDELLYVGFLENSFPLTEDDVPRLSRKTFRYYLNELLNEKLLVPVKTSDNRTKHYSITPLGIIRLMKSYQFSSDIKYPHPERNHVIMILQTFAQQHVKPYKSIIFNKEKFFDSKRSILGDLAKWPAIGFKHAIIDVFTNVIIERDYRDEYGYNLEFFFSSGYYESDKISLANFDIHNSSITIRELDNRKYYGPNYLEKNTKNEISSLDDEQFHHYLANLMLCSLITYAAILDYDLLRLKINKTAKAKRRKPELEEFNKFDENMHDAPEYFLRILFLFSKHILRLTKNQFDLTSDFDDRLNKVQFMN